MQRFVAHTHMHENGKFHAIYEYKTKKMTTTKFKTKKERFVRGFGLTRLTKKSQDKFEGERELCMFFPRERNI
jgi:hypothetical protein